MSRDFDADGGDACRLYTVEPGDNLYRIAEQFQTPLAALHDANPNLDVLQVGMRVCVPTSGWGGGEGGGVEGLPPNYAVKYHNLELAQPSSSSSPETSSPSRAAESPAASYDGGGVGTSPPVDEPRLPSPTRHEVASLSLALAAPTVSVTATRYAHDRTRPTSSSPSSSSSPPSPPPSSSGSQASASRLLSVSGRPPKARSKTAAQKHRRRNEDRERLRLPAAQPLRSATHEVASGDTLNLISSVYGVPVAVIQHLNDLHPDSVIYPGEVLRVPSPLHATTHTVVPGDNLNLLSSVYDIPMESIQALNALTPDSIIYPGTVLRVASPHVSRGGGGRGNKPKRSHAPTASGAPVPTAVGTVRSFVRRVVRFLPNAPDQLIRGAVTAVRTVAGAVRAPRWRPNMLGERPADGHVVVGHGESLASMAQDNGLSIRALQKLNGITSDMVEPGEVLRVTHLAAAERKPHLRR
eukprot:CAMPEP_0181375166 /NCGR_PEP_ID=MMETSP1106-20121128/16479_1 /TAXON_ID=81844 /ORGANISM="Mantoniella antarctica, Strain SL-175" /LENGTH=466 /DNA_ID=CAMNT_0023493337 /DNA_START=132 /DNA_END=1528 /DNA_ORIENTATION=+